MKEGVECEGLYGPGVVSSAPEMASQCRLPTQTIRVLLCGACIDTGCITILKLYYDE